MLNLNQLGQAIHDPLKAYTGIPQIVKADQDLSEEEEEAIRLVWKDISPYIPDPSYGVTTFKTIPGEIDPENFSEDVEITELKNPSAVFSFTIYGPKNDPNCALYLGKAYEWFTAYRRGPEYLKDLLDVVIVDVSPITDRGTGLLEFDREERRGFDVTFRFSEKIKTVSDTVEATQWAAGSGAKGEGEQ